MVDTDDTPRSIGRRDIIKKSAVVAAAGWAAPAVVSSRAAATAGSTCADEQCETYYLFKIDAAGGGCEDRFDITVPGFNCGRGRGNPGCVPCQPTYENLLGGITLVTGAACSAGFLTFSNPSDTSLDIHLAPGFSLTFALRKTGAGCPDGGAWAPTSTSCDSSGTTYQWRGSTYSNAIIVICGPAQWGPQALAATAIVDPDELPPAELGGAGLLEDPDVEGLTDDVDVDEAPGEVEETPDEVGESEVEESDSDVTGQTDPELSDDEVQTQSDEGGASDHDALSVTADESQADTSGEPADATESAVDLDDSNQP